MWICSSVAQAAGAKTALLREKAVDNGVIYLSDLLPSSAPLSVRREAREIVVGQAPRPGSIRVFTSEAVGRVLQDDPELMGELEIPGEIVVRRSGHLITKEEVTEAIQANLQHNEAFSKLAITSADVHFAAAVLVSTANADLQVTRIEVDHTLQKLNFWLVSRTDPAILPFLVSVRPQDTSDTLIGLEEGEPSQNSGSENKQQRPYRVRYHQPLAHIDTQPPVIVEAGKIAQLHLVSGKTTEMFLPVTALERGALGQRIRARMETGRVLDAQVVGPEKLEANF
jgi:hypothetical protein